MKIPLLKTKRTRTGFWTYALRQGIPVAVGIVWGSLIAFAIRGKRGWEFLAEFVAVQFLLIPVMGALHIILHKNHKEKEDIER